MDQTAKFCASCGARNSTGSLIDRARQPDNRLYAFGASRPASAVAWAPLLHPSPAPVKKCVVHPWGVALFLSFLMPAGQVNNGVDSYQSAESINLGKGI